MAFKETKTKSGSYTNIHDELTHPDSLGKIRNPLARREQGGELKVWRADADKAGIIYDEVNNGKYNSKTNPTGGSAGKHASTHRGGLVVVTNENIDVQGGEEVVLGMLQKVR